MKVLLEAAALQRAADRKERAQREQAEKAGKTGATQPASRTNE